ncbi:S-layer homology domain-containing protein [Papillibacter cinnamivorans]|nr:S-layer homology domain-containing protein [Papillibacter cinnamivorans]
MATPYSTTKIHVTFHYGKDSSEDSRQELLVDVLKKSGTTLQKVTTYNFNIPYGTDPRGDYSCIVGGLEPETQYYVRIKGSAGWYDDVNVAEHYYYSDLFPVTTPEPARPTLGAIQLQGLTATSVSLKATLVSTGTGFPFDPANPVWNLSGELLGEQLVIYKAAEDTGENLQADDARAVASVGPRVWSDSDNLLRYSHTLSGLEPGTAYVAQASISNVHSFIGYSSKLYFTTYSFPAVAIDSVSPHTASTYVYADVTMDPRDTMQSLALYAAPADSVNIPLDPDVVVGSLVDYDGTTGRAMFRLVGLTAETDYAAVVELKSQGAIAWSSAKTFTTPLTATAAIIHTQAATAIRDTHAMLHAYIESVGNSYILEQGFIYSDTNENPGRDDPDATVIYVPITSQSDDTAISAPLDNLTPNQHYWFRSFVRTNVGVTYGIVLPFMTLRSPEAATLANQEFKTSSSIQLSGFATSTGGLSPTLRGIVYAQVPLTPALGATGSKFVLDSVVDGDITGRFDLTLTGLAAGTTYKYRAFLHNESGTFYGDELFFTTETSEAVLPSVTTLAINPTTITTSSVLVSGHFDEPTGAGNDVTETGFVFSQFPNPIVNGPDTEYWSSGDIDGDFSRTLTGLSPDTTYYVRACAKNGTGFGYGADVSFTTDPELGTVAPPVITSLDITGVTANTIGVKLTWSPPAAAGSILYSATNHEPTLGGDGVSEFSLPTVINRGMGTIEGLTRNTTYYLRGYARVIDPTRIGGYAVRYGDVVAVTTHISGPPVVGIPVADPVAELSASVTVSLDPNGRPLSGALMVWSSEITEPAFGMQGVNSRELNFTSTVPVSKQFDLTGLRTGTTYYYRIYAYNADGCGQSGVETFTTDTADPPVFAVTGAEPGSSNASITAQMTQDGTGSRAAYCLGILVSATPDPNFITSGVLYSPVFGAGTDPFTADFSGLSPSTTYYARPYVSTVYDETFWGESYSFTTGEAPLAAVTLYGPFDVDDKSAGFTVDVTSSGGNPILQRGLVYNTTGVPTTGENAVECEGAGSDPGRTAAALTGLTEGMRYYVRAYALTANGTAYSTDEVVFLAVDSPITVQFDANGGTCETAADIVGAEGKLSALPEAQWEGYIFDGWFTLSSGGDEITTDTVFTEDVIVYARWTPTAAIKTVTFDPNGGSLSPATALTDADGKLASLPVPTWPGNEYVFNGWYTDASEGTAITTHTVYEEATTIYAHWTFWETGSLPTVVTVSAAGTGYTSGTFTGEVTAMGSATVSERGFLASYTINPNYGNSTYRAEYHVDEGDGTGSFSGQISGFASGVTYHVRAYAINEGGISYGEDMTFTTLLDTTENTIQTNPVTALTPAGATFRGSLTLNSAAVPYLTERGFVYGDFQDPELGDPGVTVLTDALAVAGDFSAAAIGLTPGTAYHVRAYAILNYEGLDSIGYGEDVEFTTSSGGEIGVYVPPEEPAKEDEVPPAGKIGYLDMPETDNPWGNVVLYTDADGEQFIVGLGIVEGSRMKYISRGPVQYEIIYNAKDFDDIGGHWAKNDIDFNSARLLFLGVTPNLFAPDAPMTRGMFVTVIGRMFGADPGEYTDVPFGDVPQAAYYAPYVQWAAENGIVLGVSADKFEPERPVTRQEMAAIMQRFMTFLGLDLADKGAAFNDEAQIAGWAQNDVDSMRGTGILNGKPDNLFDPLAASTRAEAAVVFRRLIEYIVNSAS